MTINQFNQMNPLKLGRPALIGAAAVALTLGLSLPAVAAPTADFVLGTTNVQLSGDFVNALTSLKVPPGAIGDGRLRNGIAAFPIISGAGDIGATKLEINHRGGLSLKAGGTIVELTDFAITNLGGKPVLTGLVKANDDLVGRIPLFDLTLASAPTTQSLRLRNYTQRLTVVEVKNVNVALSQDAATALNGVFKVTAFQAGLNIGTAKVQAFGR